MTFYTQLPGFKLRTVLALSYKLKTYLTKQTYFGLVKFISLALQTETNFNKQSFFWLDLPVPVGWLFGI